MQLDSQNFRDLDFVQHSDGVRIVARMPGRYALADRRTLLGERRQFACRAVTISPRELTLAAPVNGELGDRVITHFDVLGKLEGPIVRLFPERGFVMKITASREERIKLAGKIDWFEKNKNHDLPDRRHARRIIPNNPHSTLLFADGSTLGCFVIDMSISGAAVSADFMPEVGMPLAVGTVVGRVVRILEDGFAVQFLDPQEPETLEQMLIKR